MAYMVKCEEYPGRPEVYYACRKQSAYRRRRCFPSPEGRSRDRVWAAPLHVTVGREGWRRVTVNHAMPWGLVEPAPPSARARSCARYARRRHVINARAASVFRASMFRSVPVARCESTSAVAEQVEVPLMQKEGGSIARWEGGIVTKRTAQAIRHGKRGVVQTRCRQRGVSTSAAPHCSVPVRHSQRGGGGSAYGRAASD